jgi:hypothetical protein
MFNTIEPAFFGLLLLLLQPPAHLGSRNPPPEGKNVIKFYFREKGS